MNIDGNARLKRRHLAAGGACLLAAAGLAVLFALLQTWAHSLGPQEWIKGLDEHNSAIQAAECARWTALASSIVLACAGLWSLAAGAWGGRGWAGPSIVPGLQPVAMVAPRWFWPALGAILLLALGLRLPRMTLSFYNDESHNYIRFIGGDWKVFEEGNRKFRVPPWTDTAFRNSSGNNGFFFSLTARACLEGWRKATGAAEGVVKEWPVRLPALVSGLATVGALALALRRCGRPGAGLVAALLLALHPWHVRYSTEGRGYALMMAALAIGIFFLIRGLQTGRWRDWAGQGLCQFAALWAYPGALFAVVCAQAAVGGSLAFRWMRGRGGGGTPAGLAGIHLLRWAGGGLLAVIAATFFLAPGLIDLRAQLQSNPSLVRPEGQPLPVGWWRETFSLLAVGCGWSESSPDNPLNPVAEGHPARVAAIGAMGVVLLVGGFRALRDPASRMAGAVCLFHLVSLAVLYVYADVFRNVLLSWYGLPALPGMVICAGLSVPSGRSGSACWLSAVPLCLLAAGMGTVLPAVVTHGKADPRALARLVRGGDFPDQDPRPVSLALWSDAPIYDPRMRWVESEAALDREMEAARRENRRLFVLTSHEDQARLSHPEVMRRLKESGDFRQVEVKWALESSGHTNYLYEMQSGRPAKSFPVP